ncbi:unnamed protein product [Closterium sp. NIES-54]
MLMVRFKARWVARRFDKKQGVDYGVTFAPISRHTSLWIPLAFAAALGFKLRQIDVSIAFLYALIDILILVEQPHGYVTDSSKVYSLNKSLYGIKQAPHLWHQHLHERLVRIGVRQLPHDHGMYRLDCAAAFVLIVVYVDDLLYIGSSLEIISCLEGELKTDMTITISIDVTQYLGLNITETSTAIHLSAKKYAEKLLKRFRSTPVADSDPLHSAGITCYQ